MASIVCGWCNTQSHMTLHGKIKSIEGWGSYDDEFLADAAFICDNCGRMSVATWVSRENPAMACHDCPPSDGSPRDFETAVWNPKVGSQKTYPDVPERIAETAAEAQSCHSNSAFRAAVLLARAVAESTAKEKGIDSGNLYAKITEMASQQLIRPAVAERYTRSDTSATPWRMATSMTSSPARTPRKCSSSWMNCCARSGRLRSVVSALPTEERRRRPRRTQPDSYSRTRSRVVAD